ncbi:diacylglycerol kinase family protein [Pedobacter cryophilus]|uniref:Diacylglycerol kinase family protein n=1 Tax=Pedobacter cryophilus TaxID=2571271 RepID=A0A4U1BXS4_9SPHI|nr:diacylglycerol kinase family protein [Pedobacter cryophilus]TKB97555.1 diacylglycerol kinase family protein [Pedobacter cryophilus]
METQRKGFFKVIKSFSYAFNGLKILFKEELNAKVHFVIAIAIIICGFVFQVSGTEWIAIIFAIGLVLSLELLNTAIEQIANFISPEKHEKIKRIKDLAAASVVIGVIAAVIIGLIIFLPKIIIWAF